MQTAAAPKLRPPDQDRTIDYLSLPNLQSGSCRMRVWREPDGRVVVLVTEIHGNLGPSVTNGIEAVASQVEIAVGVPLDQLDLVEHYDANLFRPDALSLVTFAGRLPGGRPCRPEWAPLPGRLGWVNDLAVIA